MRVRIHRGAHEIGGSCVEVEAGGERLVLDVGRPLTADRNDVVPLPDITGLSDGDPSLRGVVITHAHQDHWGLVDQIPSGVPLFMGEATHNILKEAAFWTTGLTVEPAGFLVHRQSFELGPFRITPFLNDHSAFDAYSLLVEAEGRCLFYTGDIRGHGRKYGIFEELLRKPPEGVDVLLMEGTNIRTDAGPAEAQVTEDELEIAMVDTMKSTEGMVLAISSAQNIDRLVTLYRAAKRSGQRTGHRPLRREHRPRDRQPEHPSAGRSVADRARVRTAVATRQSERVRAVPSRRGDQTVPRVREIPGGEAVKARDALQPQ